MAACTSRNMDFNPYVSGVTSIGLLVSPQAAIDLCEREADDLDDYTLFYYEGYEKEYDEKEHAWRPCDYGDQSESVISLAPSTRVFQGFDIVEFSGGKNSGCSVLSCNSAAERVKTNEHCLLGTLEEAIAAIGSGAIQPAEAGPYRIIAIYTQANAA